MSRSAFACFASSVTPPAPRARGLLRWGLSLGAGLGCIVSARAASAYDVLASSCEDDPYACAIAPISFAGTDALPIEWSFDTGWVPQGSPLQVHLKAGVYAHTDVALAGALVTSWPDALTLEAPGAIQGGHLGYHYGVEVLAQAMVNISVAGQNFNWQGDIPYVPQIDLQVKADQTFDAWGWAPGATLSSKTPPQKLAQVGIADIIGGSIPGIDGGFELDVAIELQATWVNERIVLRTPEGEAVAGGPILGPELTSLAAYSGGPSIELDVHPEGFVSYDGVLHLIPAFYVELLGKQWSIPIADIPIAFPITDVDWTFSPKRVHVPLPDLHVTRTEIDFGEVEVGQKKLMGVPLNNAGEAIVQATLATSDPELFLPFDPVVEIDPGITFDTAVRFQPTKAGKFQAVLLVASNDPDVPLQEVNLRGTAYGGEMLGASVVEEDGAEDFGSAADAGGCACRSAGQGETGARGGVLAFALALAASGALARRRRRG